MKRAAALAVFAALALVLKALADPSDDAMTAALGWLKLVDAGKFEESWNAASPYFKHVTTKVDWVKSGAALPTGCGSHDGPMELRRRRLTDADVARGMQREKLQQGIDLVFEFRARQATQRPHQFEIFPTSQKGVEMSFFGNVAQFLAIGVDVILNAAAVEVNDAARRNEKSGEHFDGSAFAGAVGAHASEDLPGP